MGSRLTHVSPDEDAYARFASNQRVAVGRQHSLPAGGRASMLKTSMLKIGREEDPDGR